nr:unnamed protein product [Callosobruchus chinensis]
MAIPKLFGEHRWEAYFSKVP